jgi:hypothetical protein
MSDFHSQPEKYWSPDKGLYLLASSGSNVFKPGSAFAKNNALLAVALYKNVGVNVGEIGILSLFHLVHRYGK